MTDRELIEAAAKAAGIEMQCYNPHLQLAWIYTSTELDSHGERPITGWNPLTDDGDALRLAVKLGILVQPYSNQADALTRAVCWPQGIGRVEEFASHPDGYAATRRAIVRAAAALAKGTAEG